MQTTNFVTIMVMAVQKIEWTIATQNCRRMIEGHAIASQISVAGIYLTQKLQRLRLRCSGARYTSRYMLKNTIDFITVVL